MIILSPFRKKVDSMILLSVMSFFPIRIFLILVPLHGGRLVLLAFLQPCQMSLEVCLFRLGRFVRLVPLATCLNSFYQLVFEEVECVASLVEWDAPFRCVRIER